MRATKVGFLFFICVAVAAVVYKDYRASKTDWNPFVRDSKELEGRWHDDEATILLSHDDRYTCNGPACSAIGIRGHWARSGDFYVAFTSKAGKQVEWRLAKRDGRLHLVSGRMSGDPDQWNPEHYFLQSP